MAPRREDNALYDLTLNPDLEFWVEIILDNTRKNLEDTDLIWSSLGTNVDKLAVAIEYFNEGEFYSPIRTDHLDLHKLVMAEIERAGESEFGRYHLRLIFFAESHLLRKLIGELESVVAPELRERLETIMRDLYELPGKLAIRAHELGREDEECFDLGLKFWLDVAVLKKLEDDLWDIECKDWSRIKKLNEK